jgi:hypothetical protein
VATVATIGQCNGSLCSSYVVSLTGAGAVSLACHADGSMTFTDLFGALELVLVAVMGRVVDYTCYLA